MQINNGAVMVAVKESDLLLCTPRSEIAAWRCNCYRKLQPGGVEVLHSGLQNREDRVRVSAGLPKYNGRVDIGRSTCLENKHP